MKLDSSSLGLAAAIAQAGCWPEQLAEPARALEHQFQAGVLARATRLAPIRVHRADFSNIWSARAAEAAVFATCLTSSQPTVD